MKGNNHANILWPKTNLAVRSRDTQKNNLYSHVRHRTCAQMLLQIVLQLLLKMLLQNDAANAVANANVAANANVVANVNT